MICYATNKNNVDNIDLDSLDLRKMKNVNCTAKVHIKSSSLEFDDARNNRPYMLISGDIMSLDTHSDLPKFNLSDEEYKEFRYDFSDKQLSEMIDRGFYTSKFKVPSFKNEEFNITYSSDIEILQDGDKIINVFYELPVEIEEIPLNINSTSFNPVSYFKDHSAENERAEKVDLDIEDLGIDDIEDGKVEAQENFDMESIYDEVMNIDMDMELNSEELTSDIIELDESVKSVIDANFESQQVLKENILSKDELESLTKEEEKEEKAVDEKSVSEEEDDLFIDKLDVYDMEDLDYRDVAKEASKVESSKFDIDLDDESEIDNIIDAEYEEVDEFNEDDLDELWDDSKEDEIEDFSSLWDESQVLEDIHSVEDLTTEMTEAEKDENLEEKTMDMNSNEEAKNNIATQISDMLGLSMDEDEVKPIPLESSLSNNYVEIEPVVTEEEKDKMAKEEHEKAEEKRQALEAAREEKNEKFKEYVKRINDPMVDNVSDALEMLNSNEESIQNVLDRHEDDYEETVEEINSVHDISMDEKKRILKKAGIVSYEEEGLNRVKDMILDFE